MADLFLNRAWLMGLLTALVGVIILCLWGYRKIHPHPQKAFFLGLLKVFVFASLVWVLLEPNKKVERPVKGYYRVILLSDHSKSMLKFGKDDLSAAKQLIDILSQQHHWLGKIKENFQVQHYRFGQQLKAQLETQELEFTDSKTILSESLKTCFELHQPDQIAAILVLSDGQIQKGLDPELKKVCPPIFFVPLADPPTQPDLSIVKASATPSSYEDAPTKIKAELRADAFPSSKIRARLLDPEGKQVWKETIEMKSSTHLLDFEIKPKYTGMQFYILEVIPVDDSITERSLKNNHWTIKVDQRNGPFKILYVSGRPNWEYKYLRRALEEDPLLELSALIRIAKGEQKFEFRDKNLANINPLFQGLDKEKAEREADFDEPVFLRLNIAKEDELHKGFPSSKASLFQYHALIIDDLESQFFTSDQLQLIKDFVQLRGGACLFLGGQETFSQGGYEQSRLSGMMPVYFESRHLHDQDLRYQLTREGVLTPWARIAPELDREQLLRQRMPSFKVYHSFSRAKPGSSVIAYQPQSQNDPELILLAVQDYGLGKSAILSVGDFWRWHMQPLVEEELLKHWRQSIRYLISDTPQQHEMNIVKVDDFNYQLIARLHNEEFEPQPPQNLELIETSPNGQSQPLVFKQDPNEPQKFSLKREKNNSGSYQYDLTFRLNDKEVKLSNSHHQQVEHIETQWDDGAISRLRSLCHSSEGKVIEPHQLDNFYKFIPVKKLTQLEVSYDPLWDKSFIWIPLVLLLCLEWGLRRKWGLS